VGGSPELSITLPASQSGITLVVRACDASQVSAIIGCRPANQESLWVVTIASGDRTANQESLWLSAIAKSYLPANQESR
jgi:hypothetical protein